MEYLFFFSTSAFILGWSLYRVIWGSRRFDLLTVFYLFCLFFFGVAPVVQIVQGIDIAPMYDYALDVDDYLRCNIIIAIIIVVFELVYRMVRRYFKMKEKRRYRYVVRKKKFWLVILFFVVLLLFWRQNFNIENFLVRGDAADGGKEISKLAALIFGMCLRYVPLSVFTFYYLYGDRKKPLLCILLCVGVFCCFPTGIARLQIVPLYLPIVMICCKWMRDKKMWLVSGLVGGLLFIFPLLHGFREKDVDLSGFNFFDFSFLNSLHFDSFASLALIVKNDFITYGHQLLGSLLFWFPRSLWPDKPDSSGMLIADKFDLGMGDFNNLAVNWFGEGYLNFGWIGIFIWCVVIAAVCGWLDAWFGRDEENFDRKDAIYYFSFVGFLFFLLRGDMMSGVSYTLGLLAAHKFVEIIMLKRVH